MTDRRIRQLNRALATIATSNALISAYFLIVGAPGWALASAAAAGITLVLAIL